MPEGQKGAPKGIDFGEEIPNLFAWIPPEEQKKRAGFLADIGESGGEGAEAGAEGEGRLAPGKRKGRQRRVRYRYRRR